MLSCELARFQKYIHVYTIYFKLRALKEYFFATEIYKKEDLKSGKKILWRTANHTQIKLFQTPISGVQC